MKKSFLFAFIVALFLEAGCNKQKNNVNDPVKEVSLTEESAIGFAKEIEKGILNGRAAAIDSVIDRAHIRQIVSENSIVYSGFDVEGGEQFFEKCLQLGNTMVAAVNNGGDFAFTRYYNDGGVHHIVFRSYDNFVVNFYDFTVDTAGGRMLIQDGFVYNAGCQLSKNVEGAMLYNLMLQTNPDSDVQWLLQAEEQTRANQPSKAIATLKAHKEALRDYPAYYQLLVANLHQSDRAHFAARLDELGDELDKRYLLLHKLLYFVHEGKVTETEQCVNELIPHVGDDPVFLFLYGYANLVAKQYDQALQCFVTVDKSMPLIWDLWQCELRCYKALKDNDGFETCLQRGKEAYGMDEKELQEIREGL
jgi:hypothetical protein